MAKHVGEKCRKLWRADGWTPREISPYNNTSCWFSDQPDNDKHGRGRRFLSACQVLANSVQRFQRKKMSKPRVKGRGGYLFSDRIEKHIVEEQSQIDRHFEFFLSIKFRLIPFSSFREVESILAYERPRRPTSFSYPTGKNFVADVENLLLIKCRQIIFNGLREEEENVSANQRLGENCFFFRSA